MRFLVVGIALVTCFGSAFGQEGQPVKPRNAAVGGAAPGERSEGARHTAALRTSGKSASVGVVAELSLAGCPEGPVLNFPQPNEQVDKFFARQKPWGDEWTNALSAPKRWKMASNMKVVREAPALLEAVYREAPKPEACMVLEHPTQDDRCLLTGYPLWKDYTVEVAIRVMGTASKPNADNDVHVAPMAGIMFRCQTVRHYYFFAIEPGLGFALYWRDDDDWNLLASSPAQIEPERYYKLRVTVSGNSIRCLEGVRPLIELADDHLAFGKAGVRFNTEARVAYAAVFMTPQEFGISKRARADWDREEQELSQKLPRPVLWKSIDLATFGGSPLGFSPTRDPVRKEMILVGRGEKGPAIMAVTLEGQKLWECPGTMRIPQISGPLKDGSYRLTGILTRPDDPKKEVLAAINLRDGKVVAEAEVPTIPGRQIKFMFSTNSLADLRGVGAPSDFILREGDDGNTLWAYDDQLKLLWTTKVVPNFGHGNSLGFCDVNGDGKEEILAGGTLLTPDGKMIWQMDKCDEFLKKNGGAHVDAVVIGDIADDPIFLPDRPAVRPADRAKRLKLDPVVSLQGGSGGAYFLDARTGKLQSLTRVGHAQGRYVGKFRPDVPGLQIEVGDRWGNYGIITLFSAKGERLCTFQPDTLSQGGPPVNWTGDGQEHIFIYTSKEAFGFYDGWGRRVLQFKANEIPEGIGYARGTVYVEDLTGDPRDELAFAGDGKLLIYTQDRPPANPGRVYAPRRRSVISYPAWKTM